MNISKHDPEYLEAVSYVGLCEADMAAEGLAVGDKVKVASAQGEVTISVKKMDVQSGSFFMPVSFLANRLVSADTHGAGVPGFKNTRVTIVKA